MGVLIEMVGYNGKPIFIAKEKIMSFSDADAEKYGAPATTITMALGESSEEWIVHETIDAVRHKYDNA